MTRVGALSDSSQSFRELGADRYGDIPLKQAYYLSEHPNLVVGIPAGYQYIGRIPQRSLAALCRSPRHRNFEFLQK